MVAGDVDHAFGGEGEELVEELGAAAFAGWVDDDRCSDNTQRFREISRNRFIGFIEQHFSVILYGLKHEAKNVDNDGDALACDGSRYSVRDAWSRAET